MSRAGNMVGSFVIEDRGSAERRPWTKVDEDRLQGNYVHKFQSGAAIKQPPHVDTPSGPFFIGSVKLAARTIFCHCPDCKERKVRRVDRRLDVYRCDSCGQEHSIQFLRCFAENRT